MDARKDRCLVRPVEDLDEEIRQSLDRSVREGPSSTESTIEPSDRLVRLNSKIQDNASACAELLLTAFRLEDAAGKPDNASRYLKAHVGLSEIVGSDPQLIPTLLASRFSPRYAREIGPVWGQGHPNEYPALCISAQRIERVSRGLESTRPDWGEIRRHASAIAWDLESAVGESAQVHRFAAGQLLRLFEQWRWLVRRAPAGVRNEFHSAKYCLCAAITVRPERDALALSAMAQMMEVLRTAPRVATSIDDVSASLEAIAHELRSAALMLTQGCLDRGLPAEVLKSWGQAAFSLAQQEVDNARAIELLLEATRAYEQLLREVPDSASGEKAETCRQLGIVALSLALFARASEMDPSRVREFSKVAQRWFLKAGAIWEPGCDLTAIASKDPRNVGLHLYLSAAGTVADDVENALRQSGFECLGEPVLSSVAPDFVLSLGTWPYRLVRAEGIAGVADILKDTAAYFPDSLRLKRRILYTELRRPARSRGSGIGLIVDDLLLQIQQHDREIVGLTSEHVKRLRDPFVMAQWLTDCRAQIGVGTAASLIRDLPIILEAARALSIDGNTPDDHLLTLQAEALCAVRNFKSALRVLDEAYEADSSTRNRAEVWFQRGGAYLGLNDAIKAADAFKRSYIEGGCRSFGPLLMAAKAMAQAGQFSQAIALIRGIIASGRDTAPWKSKTELARILWRRYQSTPATNNSDASEACAELAPMVTGERAEADPYAAHFLVEMAAHDEARSLILDILKNGQPTAKAHVLSKLKELDCFEPRIIDAVIDSTRDLLKLPTGLPLFTDYLMGAWVNAYFNYLRADFLTFIATTVVRVWRIETSQLFWSRLLACNKGALLRRIQKSVRQEVRSLDSGIVERNGQDVLRALFAARLQTKLLDVTPPNYSGKELSRQDGNRSPASFGVHLGRRLQFILGEYLTGAAEDRIAGKVHVQTAEPGAIVSDFQARWVGRFIARLLERIGVQLPGESTGRFDINVEPRDENVCVRLSIHFTGDAVLNVNRLLNSDTFLAQWTDASNTIAPKPIEVSISEVEGSASVTLWLWPSRTPNNLSLAWAPFYEYVVERTWSYVDLGGTYYPTALRRMPSEANLVPESICAYVHSHLDGLYAQITKRERPDDAAETLSELGKLLSILHSAAHVLGAGDRADLRSSKLRNLQTQILSSISEGEGRRDFDLCVLIEEVVERGRQLRGDIEWNVSAPSAESMLVVTGYRSLVWRALWDILTNAFNAMDFDKEPSCKKAILIEVVPELESFVINVFNTGPTVEMGLGHGIGTSTLEFTARSHGGVYGRGPDRRRQPYRYCAWLRMAISSLNQENPRE